VESNYSGMKVTIMGLGLNGGGLESARYLALHGAECTITDMKDEKTLAPSIDQLENISLPHPPFRYVLGRHEMDDFRSADMVIKNPGVRPDSPYLAAARRVETDIGLFLAASPARLSAVTGSKGKSSTSSALHWALAKARETTTALETKALGAKTLETPLLPGKAWLGGNITVSPLTFLDELSETDDVVLELSSWQLGDLKGRGGRGGQCRDGFGRNDQGRNGQALLKPRIAILTAIMPDHQDYYGSMEAYVNDKRIIYQGQDKTCATIASGDDDWGRSFLAETPGRPLPYTDQTIADLVPPAPLVPGSHQKKNLAAAAVALLDLGLPADFIRESLGSFPGIEHRLEFFREIDGIRFYNDTAATIPEAAAAAIEALSAGTDAPLILVTGGTDKNLDFSPLVGAAATASKAGALKDIVLLAGTGSDKLIPLLENAGLSFHGPCGNIDDAARAALDLAKKGVSHVQAAPWRRRTTTSLHSPTVGRHHPAAVVLSPGCASFGMFRNEFDRGRQWKEAVRRLGE